MAEVSPKKRVVALVLCFIAGTIGLHRFYVGKNATGILMILTLGGAGIWTFIDLAMILMGVFTDKDSKELREWT